MIDLLFRQCRLFTSRENRGLQNSIRGVISRMLRVTGIHPLTPSTPSTSQGQREMTLMRLDYGDMKPPLYGRRVQHRSDQGVSMVVPTATGALDIRCRTPLLLRKCIIIPGQAIKIFHCTTSFLQFGLDYPCNIESYVCVRIV